MRVKNDTSSPLIAFAWHKTRGYGVEVVILQGEVGEISGPYLGEMDGHCWVAVPGETACHEAVDTDSHFQVLRGKPLSLGGGEIGFTIRHHEDPRDIPDEVYYAELRAGPPMVNNEPANMTPALHVVLIPNPNEYK